MKQKKIVFFIVSLSLLSILGLSQGGLSISTNYNKRLSIGSNITLIVSGWESLTNSDLSDLEYIFDCENANIEKIIVKNNSDDSPNIETSPNGIICLRLPISIPNDPKLIGKLDFKIKKISTTRLLFQDTKLYISGKKPEIEVQSIDETIYLGESAAISLSGNTLKSIADITTSCDSILSDSLEHKVIDDSRVDIKFTVDPNLQGPIFPSSIHFSMKYNKHASDDIHSELVQAEAASASVSVNLQSRTEKPIARFKPEVFFVSEIKADRVKTIELELSNPIGTHFTDYVLTSTTSSIFSDVNAGFNSVSEKKASPRINFIENITPGTYTIYLSRRGTKYYYYKINVKPDPKIEEITVNGGAPFIDPFSNSRIELKGESLDVFDGTDGVILFENPEINEIFSIKLDSAYANSSQFRGYKLVQKPGQIISGDIFGKKSKIKYRFRNSVGSSSNELEFVDPKKAFDPSTIISYQINTEETDNFFDSNNYKKIKWDDDIVILIKNGFDVKYGSQTFLYRITLYDENQNVYEIINSENRIKIYPHQGNGYKLILSKIGCSKEKIKKWGLIEVEIYHDLSQYTNHDYFAPVKQIFLIKGGYILAAPTIPPLICILNLKQTRTETVYNPTTMKYESYIINEEPYQLLALNVGFGLKWEGRNKYGKQIPLSGGFYLIGLNVFGTSDENENNNLSDTTSLIPISNKPISKGDIGFLLLGEVNLWNKGSKIQSPFQFGGGIIFRKGNYLDDPIIKKGNKWFLTIGLGLTLK